MNFVVAVLAAGESRRFGSPKQLAEWDGATFIERAIGVASEVGPREVLVILGANIDAIRPTLVASKLVKVVGNPDWREGMGSSVRVAASAALESSLASPSDGVELKPAEILLIVLVDQPQLTASHLERLVKATQESGLAATSYNGLAGVPAAFDSSHFSALAKLTGDVGARDYLRSQSPTLVDPDFNTTDIDQALQLHAKKIYD